MINIFKRFIFYRFVVELTTKNTKYWGRRRRRRLRLREQAFSSFRNDKFKNPCKRFQLIWFHDKIILDSLRAFLKGNLLVCWSSSSSQYPWKNKLKQKSINYVFFALFVSNWEFMFSESLNHSRMFHLLRVKFNKIVLFSSLFPKKQKHFELNIVTPTEVQFTNGKTSFWDFFVTSKRVPVHRLARWFKPS